MKKQKNETTELIEDILITISATTMVFFTAFSLLLTVFFIAILQPSEVLYFGLATMSGVGVLSILLRVNAGI